MSSDSAPLTPLDDSWIIPNHHYGDDRADGEDDEGVETHCQEGRHNDDLPVLLLDAVRRFPQVQTGLSTSLGGCTSELVDLGPRASRAAPGLGRKERCSA